METKHGLRSRWQLLGIGRQALIIATFVLLVAALISVTVNVFESDPPTSQAPTTKAAQAVSKSSPKLPPDKGDDSRASAVRLSAGVPTHEAVNSANDVDWYVYRAPEGEKASLSLSMDPAEEQYGSQRLAIFKGGKQIEEDWIMGEERSVTHRVSLARGEKLYLKMWDFCGDGCGVATYHVTLASG